MQNAIRKAHRPIPVKATLPEEGTSLLLDIGRSPGLSLLISIVYMAMSFQSFNLGSKPTQQRAKARPQFDSEDEEGPVPSRGGIESAAQLQVGTGCWAEGC